MELFVKNKACLIFLASLFIYASPNSVPEKNVIPRSDKVVHNATRFLAEKIKHAKEKVEYSCPEGWIMNFDSSMCFHEFSTHLTWEDSRDFCRDDDGDLVSLHSEDDFILAKSLVIEDTWIGLNDINIEGEYEWSDGSSVDYTHWASGEPNNKHGKEDCTDLKRSKSYDMNDEECTREQRFICGKEPEALFSCPVDWTPNSDSSKCFRQIIDKQSWQDSLEFCRDAGGDLASLHSESDFVLAISLISEDTWIGLNDIDTEGVMEWSDHSEVDFESWYPGEPNDQDGTDNCVEMHTNYNFDFNDRECSIELRSLCEIDPL